MGGRDLKIYACSIPVKKKRGRDKGGEGGGRTPDHVEALGERSSVEEGGKGENKGKKSR